MKYIAIDVGSSYIKSALLDMNTCTTLVRKKIPSPEKLLSNNTKHFEIPADVFVSLVRDMIDFYTAKYHDIDGIIFCTQMHGFIYAARDSNNIYVSWQDMRCLNIADGKSKSFMDILREKFSRSDMTDCGVYIKPSLGMCNLLALFEMENLPKDGELYTLGSYIISKLTGTNVCHPQNAAPLGLFNVAKNKWNERIIRECNFEFITLPSIAQNDFEPVGKYSSNGLTLSVFPDYGDQQASILGSMANFGDAILNISTGAQVVIPTPFFRPQTDYETRPYFEGAYINTISNMPGGRGLDVLVNFLRDSTQQITGVQVSSADIWNGIHKSFKSEPYGIKVDTTFYPVPYNLDGGSIKGIMPSNLSMSSLFAATFFDMANTYIENINKMTDRKKIKRLICAGGVSWRTPELVTIIEKVFRESCKTYNFAVSKDCTVTEYLADCILSPIEDESLCGLFRAGLICSGQCKNLKETVRYVERLIKNENT